MQTKPQKITPFLMFTGEVVGKAEQAMNCYISMFDDSQVLSLVKHDGTGGEIEGSVLNAVFTLNGQTFICMDSNAPHQFTFNPAISLYVDCYTEEEIERVFAELSTGGFAFMPLGEYPFAKKFGWVQDKFGVSWQLIYGRTL